MAAATIRSRTRRRSEFAAGTDLKSASRVPIWNLCSGALLKRDLKSRMANVRKYSKGAVFVAVCLCAVGSVAHAQSRSGADDYPFSIMKPEPGERRARPPVQQVTPPEQPQTQPSEQPAREAKQVQRRVRGSSTLSTIPTYQSPLTPLGTAPTIGTAPSYAFPSSPSAPVPGVRGRGGTIAVTPQRPAGQNFQNRTTSCTMAAGSQGVRPGQTGTFVRNCVNR